MPRVFRWVLLLTLWAILSPSLFAQGKNAIPRLRADNEPVNPSPAAAPSPATKPEATPAASNPPATAAKAPEPKPASTLPTVKVQWLGHSFIYITTSTGVRVGLDPFDETVRLPFPNQLFSEVLLISSTRDDHSAAERMNALAVFRSDAALGPCKAHGYIFKGIKSYQDRDRGHSLGNNTIFQFEIDGVRFAHLGSLGHSLDSRLRDEIGQVDVLFLPVGITQNTVGDWSKIARELGAKIIVPINYLTDATPGRDLRPLADWLGNQTNITKPELAYFEVNPSNLPATPTIFVLPSPPATVSNASP